MKNLLTQFFCAAVLASVAHAQVLSFSAAQSFASGANSYGLDVADFNGDGILDVVVADSNVSTISVLMGIGGGVFAAPVTYRSFAAPKHPIAIDLNGDGWPDIVATNYYSQNNGVEVYINKGNGTFRTPVSYPTCAPGPYGIAAAVLANDGVMDIIVTNGGNSISQFQNQISILPSNGDGTLGTPTCVTVGASPMGVVIGDFNGDGIPDIATANFWANSMSVLIGQGNLTYAPMVRYAAGVNPMAIAAADLNGDGILDIVVSNHGSAAAPDAYLSVYIGNGDGTFKPQVLYATGGQFGKKLAIADLNGDGIPDIVVPSFLSSNFSVLLGNGDGTFQAPVIGQGGAGPVDVVARDINGDGLLDLVFADITGGTVSVLLGH